MADTSTVFPSYAQAAEHNELLALIAGKLGALEDPKTWAVFQALVRQGRIGRYLSAGDQVEVNSSYLVTADVGESTGITAANVTGYTFVGATGSQPGVWEFDYSGAAWMLNGAAVNLAAYGVSLTGTPVEGDTIVVTVNATTADYDVMGIDQEQPVNPNLTHSLTLMMHDVLSTINFDPPQYLWPVTAESLASIGVSGNVLPAGTYHVTLDHAAYNGSTTQDTTIQITTTQDVPIGGGIRHSQVGAYRSDGAYTVANLLAGVWTTYGASTYTVIETNLATTEGSDGISLGTTTASNPTYKVGDYINFSQRQAYGSGRWSTSYIRQLLNSEDAVLSWVPKTIWSRNLNITPEGFLHSIDPELRAVLTKVRKRYAPSISDGDGYEDVEDTVTLATLLDIFGQQNNGINEGPVDAEGNVVRTVAYSYWQDHNTNADRIKYQGTTPRFWCVASCYPSLGFIVRLVYTSGALSYGNASSSYGVVPCLHIG